MDNWNANDNLWTCRRRRRSTRVRPYVLSRIASPLTSALVPRAESAPDPGLLSRVLDGLRSLPDPRPPQVPPVREAGRTPLVRLIDAQNAPTEEIPVVSAGVSRR